MRASLAAPALVLASLLGACGGSGGGGGTSATRPAAPTARVAAPRTTTTAARPHGPRPRRPRHRATHPRATTRPATTTVATVTTPPPVKTAPEAPPTATTPARTRPPKPGPAPAGRYAGTGSVRLGTFTVRRQTVLRWTSTGTRFRIIYEGSAVALDTRTHAGRIVVPAMTFPATRVVTDGRWTITVGG